MATTVTETELEALNSEQNNTATTSDTEQTYEGKFVGTLVGNATTAKELEAPYRLTLTGDVSGTTQLNASDTNMSVTVNHASSADTADFAGKTNLAARSTLADMANTAEFSYRAGKLSKLFVNITGACVGSGSATDTDTIDINVDNINVGELFVIGSLPDEKTETSRIYADISNRHFWIYNNDTAKWYDCFEQLEAELDNHELRIADLEKLDLSNRVTSLETRANANDTTNADFEKRITANANDIDAVEDRATSLESRVTTNESDIAKHIQRIVNNENNIASLDSRVNNIETTTDVGELAVRLGELEATLDNDVTEIKTDIKTNYLPLTGGEMYSYDGVPALNYNVSDDVTVTEDTYTSVDTDHSSFELSSPDARVTFTNAQNDKTVALSNVKYTSTIDLNLQFYDKNNWRWWCLLPTTTEPSTLVLDTTSDECVTWNLSNYQPNHTDDTEEKPTAPEFDTTNVISKLTLVSDSSFEGTATVIIYNLCNCYKDTIGSKEDWNATLIKKTTNAITANANAITAETQARKDADSVLSQSIQNAIQPKINQLTTDLQTETTARTVADSTLEKRVVNLENTSTSISDNYVTTDTEQSISAKKYFNNDLSISYYTFCAGQIELSNSTSYIDFHYQNSTTDYTSRIIEYASGCLSVEHTLNVSDRVQQGGADLVPAGTVIAFAGGYIPGGYILCNGSAISRTAYPKLFSAIGTLFGAGDGSTTFNLPDLRNRFIEGADTGFAYLNAGLPNIFGAFSRAYQSRGHMTAGAFSMDYGEYYQETATNNPSAGISFYASRSNAIYGASGTVQPPALKLWLCIKY